MKRAHPTILIVDDDPDDLTLIQAAFQATGVAAKIQTASGGDDAIAYLKGTGRYADRRVYEYPSFVITDLKMPGVNGFELLDYLKNNPDSATIPTVVLSGSQDNDDIRKSYMLGAASYHVKPSAPAALRTIVKTLLDYWMLCELPEAGGAGPQSAAGGNFKLSEKAFPRSHGDRNESPGGRAN